MAIILRGGRSFLVFLQHLLLKKQQMTKPSAYFSVFFEFFKIFQQMLINFRPSVTEISEGVKNEGMCQLVVDTNKLNEYLTELIFVISRGVDSQPVNSSALRFMPLFLAPIITS